MAKENEFVERLQKDVITSEPAEGSLEEKRQELQKAISEMETNVIKDPKQLERLKKELASVEKAINQQEAEKAVENGEIVGKGAAEKDMDEAVKKEEEKEQEEEIKDEKDLNSQEREEQEKKEAELKQAYHDALIAYYNKRVSTLREQNEKGLLVSNIDDYNQELELEDKMYIARDSYMLLGKEDPYVGKRQELDAKEKEARDRVNNKLNERAAEYRRLEEELRVYDKQERELREQIKSAQGKDVDALQKELNEIQIKKDKTKQRIIEVKDNLGEAITELQRRANERSGRGGLESRRLDMMSEEETKNYYYLKDNVAKRNNNYKQAEKLEYKQIRITIEQREENIKQLNKKLKELPETDLEERIKTLKALDEEAYELKNAREAKVDMDRGIALPEIKAKQEAERKAKVREERSEDFDKSTKNARAVEKEQEEKMGAAVVKNPAAANIEEQERESTIDAATFAIVADGPEPGPDTPIDDAAQFALARTLQKGVKKFDDKTEEGRRNAEEYLAQDKQIKQAQQELQQVQENIEQQVQG